MLEIEIGFPILNFDLPDLSEVEIASYFSRFWVEIENRDSFSPPKVPPYHCTWKLVILTRGCTRPHTSTTAARQTTHHTLQGNTITRCPSCWEQLLNSIIKYTSTSRWFERAEKLRTRYTRKYFRANIYASIAEIVALGGPPGGAQRLRNTRLGPMWRLY